MSKLITLSNLGVFADQIKAKYARQAALEALQTKVNELITAGGEPNKLEGVKVNGVALAIASKMVDILVTTGTANGSISVNGADVAVAGLQALAFKAKITEAELDAALLAVINGKADKATTLAGYGIADAYTSAQTDTAIANAIGQFVEVSEEEINALFA